MKHIVFGHDPGALGDRGAIRASKNGVLVLLHVQTEGEDSAEILDAKGSTKKLL